MPDETEEPKEKPQPEGAAPAADPLALPRPRSRLTLWLTLAAIALSILGSLVYHHYQWKEWEAEWTKVGPIEASGGLFFPTKLEIKVPRFRQSDEHWGSDKLGHTKATLSAEGCAVTSAAMVLAAYGADTDPGRLNAALTEHEGYVGNGWLVWEKAAEVTGNLVQKAYEDLPSYRLIDEQLQRRNPVIVRLKTKGPLNHFVVIAGKEGYDYLTLDPGSGAEKGLYPLKEFGSKIEALRFYEPVKKAP